MNRIAAAQRIRCRGDHPDNLSRRILTMEASLADALAVIRTVGATKSVLGDALREYSNRMGRAEDLAQDTNRRISALEKSLAEIKDLLVQAVDH
jgi:uncharacterized membrane protein YccC